MKSHALCPGNPASIRPSLSTSSGPSHTPDGGPPGSRLCGAEANRSAKLLARTAAASCASARVVSRSSAASATGEAGAGGATGRTGEWLSRRWGSRIGELPSGRSLPAGERPRERSGDGGGEEDGDRERLLPRCAASCVRRWANTSSRVGYLSPFGPR